MQVPTEQIGIKKIYASSFLQTSLWSFVTAQKLCNVDTSEAIRSFQSFFDLHDLDFSALRKTYYRKNEEYKKDAKNVKLDAKDVFYLNPEDIDHFFSIIRNKLFEHERRK